MTNVFLNISPINVVVHRHDDSIFELFRLNVVVLHRSSDFLKLLVVLCVLRNLSTRTRLVLHQHGPIHDVAERGREPLNFAGTRDGEVLLTT